MCYFQFVKFTSLTRIRNSLSSVSLSQKIRITSPERPKGAKDELRKGHQIEVGTQSAHRLLVFNVTLLLAEPDGQGSGWPLSLNTLNLQHGVAQCLDTSSIIGGVHLNKYDHI